MLTCNLGAGKLESCGPAPAPAVRLWKLAVPEGQTKWVWVSNDKVGRTFWEEIRYPFGKPLPSYTQICRRSMSEVAWQAFAELLASHSFNVFREIGNNNPSFATNLAVRSVGSGGLCRRFFWFSFVFCCFGLQTWRFQSAAASTCAPQAMSSLRKLSQGLIAHSPVECPDAPTNLGLKVGTNNTRGYEWYNTNRLIAVYICLGYFSDTLLYIYIYICIILFNFYTIWQPFFFGQIAMSTGDAHGFKPPILWVYSFRGAAREACDWSQLFGARTSWAK